MNRRKLRAAAFRLDPLDCHDGRSRQFGAAHAMRAGSVIYLSEGCAAARIMTIRLRARLRLGGMAGLAGFHPNGRDRPGGCEGSVRAERGGHDREPAARRKRERDQTKYLNVTPHCL